MRRPWGLAWQAEPFRGAVGPAAGSTAGWTWPAALGGPLALVVLLAYVVAPLAPYEPREVCDRFVEAGSAAEAKRYATANLHPAIDAMFKQQEGEGELTFELTGESPAAADVGGYLVGYRLLMTEHGKTERMEGVFHLVDFGGGWKVEDWLVTAFDGREADPPVSFAREYERMFGPDVPPPASKRPTGATAGGMPGGAAAEPEKSWWERNKNWVRIAGGVFAFGSWAGTRTKSKATEGEGKS